LLRKAAGLLVFGSLNVVPRMYFEAFAQDPIVFALFRSFVCTFVSLVVAAFGTDCAKVGKALPPLQHHGWLRGIFNYDLNFVMFG
jgi:hypothetical protein